jgi:hypothetical protein
LLQVEVSEIIVHEADEPNVVVDLLDSQFLASQHGWDVDPLAMQGEAATGDDDDVAIVERIGQFWQGVERFENEAAVIICTAYIIMRLPPV